MATEHQLSGNDLAFLKELARNNGRLFFPANTPSAKFDFLVTTGHCVLVHSGQGSDTCVILTKAGRDVVMAFLD
jgi:hypothetical protein